MTRGQKSNQHRSETQQNHRRRIEEATKSVESTTENVAVHATASISKSGDETSQEVEPTIIYPNEDVIDVEPDLSDKTLSYSRIYEFINVGLWSIVIMTLLFNIAFVARIFESLFPGFLNLLEAMGPILDKALTFVLALFFIVIGIRGRHVFLHMSPKIPIILTISFALTFALIFLGWSLISVESVTTISPLPTETQPLPISTQMIFATVDLFTNTPVEPKLTFTSSPISSQTPLPTAMPNSVASTILTVVQPIASLTSIPPPTLQAAPDSPIPCLLTITAPDGANFRDAPSLLGRIITTLPQSSQTYDVIGIASNDEDTANPHWYQVKFSAGMVAWVSTRLAMLQGVCNLPTVNYDFSQLSIPTATLTNPAVVIVSTNIQNNVVEMPTQTPALPATRVIEIAPTATETIAALDPTKDIVVTEATITNTHEPGATPTNMPTTTSTDTPQPSETPNVIASETPTDIPPATGTDTPIPSETPTNVPTLENVESLTICWADHNDDGHNTTWQVGNPNASSNIQLAFDWKVFNNSDGEGQPVAENQALAVTGTISLVTPFAHRIEIQWYRLDGMNARNILGSTFALSNGNFRCEAE